jgi:hypothetical protein
MEYYNIPMVAPYAKGPDGVGQEQRRLAESPVEGVEVEGVFQREQAQFQPQNEEVSPDDRRGRRVSYIQSRQAAVIPLC